MFKNIMLCVLCVFVLGGCIATGQKISPASLAAIQRGVTTEYDIRQMFGEPTRVRQNSYEGRRVLTYAYHNDENLKRGTAAVVGGLIGGAIGHQIGGGTGRDIATTLGATSGLYLGANAVSARQQDQQLDVVIDMRTGRVVDFYFDEQSRRSHPIHFNPGVGTI